MEVGFPCGDHGAAVGRWSDLRGICQDCGKVVRIRSRGVCEEMLIREIQGFGSGWWNRSKTQMLELEDIGDIEASRVKQCYVHDQRESRILCHLTGNDPA